MSLPRELLEELLSGYMDGELSADERARVEQMLAVDPAVRESLRLLQEQSETIRASFRAVPGLEAAFAERVLAATFAEAERQSLDESHPVRRAAANRPSAPHPVSRRPGTHRSSGFGRRPYVAGLAVAAGLVMAAIFFVERGNAPPLATGGPQEQGTQDQGAQDQGAPEQGPNRATALQDESRAEAREEGSRDTVELLPDAVDDLLPEAEDLLPETGVDSALAGPVSPMAADVPPGPVTPPGEERPMVPSERPMVPGERPMVPGERIALSDQSAAERVPDQIALRAVLVYEVNLTPLGRERNVLNRAFREAEIRTADQREIDETLVGYLRSGGVIGDPRDKDAGEDSQLGDGEVTVLFLEGSGRRLEKLMMTLLSATEEVHSVGFSLAMDPPVMAAIDSLQKVDPTEIRGDAASVVARPLAPAGISGNVGGFTAGSRSFVPLRRDSLERLGSLGGLTADEQPDITAMTFLVIRSSGAHSPAAK